MMSRLSQIIVLAILIAVVMGSTACQKRQKPQQEESTPQAPSVEDTMKKVLQGYIEGYSSPTGYFVLHDSVEQRDRKLTLGYIHSSVHHIGESRYSVCVDFVEETPRKVDTLDVDFYLKRSEGKIPTVEKFVIHKVNGVPRR